MLSLGLYKFQFWNDIWEIQTGFLQNVFRLLPF